jgi:NADH dehydrogenase FAD-containing subunit
MSGRKNIVIVGGGAFGASVAKGISSARNFDTSRYRLILVTPRPFFVHLPGLVRTAVTSIGNLEDEVLMPYDDFMKGKGEVKVGTVASFSEEKEGGEVVLESGEKIPYSALVLTPGSIWEGPLNLPVSESDIRRHFGTWRSAFEKANDIVLVGGGSVGIGE